MRLNSESRGLLDATTLCSWYPADSVHILKAIANRTERQRHAPVLQEAWDWVASLDQVDAVKFHLASSFPRKVFTNEEHASTLTQLGLAPQAALFVQVADE